MHAASSAMQCPSGHVLRPWDADAGICDGCQRQVEQHEPVMDCRRCDYCLCKSCEAAAGRPSLWGALAMLLSDVTCHAPDKAQLSLDELLLETEPAAQASAGGGRPAAEHVEAQGGAVGCAGDSRGSRGALGSGRLHAEEARKAGLARPCSDPQGPETLDLLGLQEAELEPKAQTGQAKRLPAGAAARLGA